MKRPSQCPVLYFGFRCLREDFPQKNGRLKLLKEKYSYFCTQTPRTAQTKPIYHSNTLTIMKAIRCFLLLAFAALFSSAHADERSMKPITAIGEALINYVEDNLEKEIVRLEYDILATTKTTTRFLAKDWTYTIIAFGDERFEDIDIVVYRKSGGAWVEVGRDTDSEDVALVEVSPKEQGEYKIEIKAYKFKEGYNVGHYGLIIAHE